MMSQNDGAVPLIKSLRLIDDDLHGEEPWEYISLWTKRTGLPKCLWVPVKVERGPEFQVVKVSPFSNGELKDYWVRLTVSDAPEVLDALPEGISQVDIDAIQAWIKEHKDLLNDYWEWKIDTGEFVDSLNDPQIL